MALGGREHLGVPLLAHQASDEAHHDLVLGDAELGRLFELAPGDHAEVTQQTDLTGVMLVRALLRLRVPASTPPGLAWEASIIVDGTKLASMRAKPGRERLVTDLAANVSKLSGLHTIGVRLELVTA